MGFHLKLTGSARWMPEDGGFKGDIKRAVMRSEKELALDVVSEGTRYSVKLTRDSQHVFRGRWRTDYAGDVTGSVSCNLFRSKSGYVVVGEWEEDDRTYRWWAELKSIRNFPDEKA